MTTPRKRSVSPRKSSTKVSQKENAPLLNPDFKESGFWNGVAAFNEYVCYNLPGGKPWIPMHFGVNFNKGTMMIYLFILMCYFDNFSLGAWMYLALHGNYGLMWLLKDRVFPDAGFSRDATTLSALFPFPVVLVPYYFIGYWMMQGLDEAQRNPSKERIFIAIQLYCIGVVFMVLTDAQKYLVLREKKGLITHGMTGWSRNMNYLGEMMLYASFAVLCQRNEPWYIYAYVWISIFSLRMGVKEYSLSKKPDWPAYKAKTWFLFPKLYNSTVFSLVFYTIFVGSGYYMYTHGGIEATAKSLYA